MLDVKKLPNKKRNFRKTFFSQIFETLLKYPLDTGLQDRMGRTAMHYAAAIGKGLIDELDSSKSNCFLTRKNEEKNELSFNSSM